MGFFSKANWPTPLITARRVLPPSANRRLSCKKRIVRQGRGVSARDRTQTAERFQVFENSEQPLNGGRAALQRSVADPLFYSIEPVSTRRRIRACETTKSERMTKTMGHNYL